MVETRCLSYVLRAWKGGLLRAKGVTSTVGHFNLVSGGHLKLLNPIEGMSGLPPQFGQPVQPLIDQL